jgi:hypothetical protein
MIDAQDSGVPALLRDTEKLNLLHAAPRQALSPASGTLPGSLSGRSAGALRVSGERQNGMQQALREGRDE